MMDDPEWAERHVRLMRTQPGHWCFVEGCTGSQPLMWVKTLTEVQAEQQPRGTAIDFPFPSHPLDAWLGKR
jgi:hypothetical protein